MGWGVRANCSMMARQKAGRSAGDPAVGELAVDHDFLVDDLASGVVQLMARYPNIKPGQEFSGYS
jgi:hypothetical protein